MYMSARFAGSLASVTSSFTVYSTLSVLSSLRATVDRARSAASSVVPLAMSKPMAIRIASLVSAESIVTSACARLILNSLAALVSR